MRSVRGKLYILSAVLALAGITSVYQAPDAYAAQITTRSLTLVGVGTVGGSSPGGVVNHKFTYTIPTLGTALGSMTFQYCTVAVQTACVAPTGMDASTVSATITDTGSAVTGWSLSGTPTANSVTIKRASASNPAGGGLVIQLNNIKNPTTANQTFFVRITTYSSLDGTGSPVDSGSVAASTATPIVLTGVMPETLIFCTGQTVTQNCASSTPGAINFNQLFSPTDTAVATSQMAASTNAGSGYVITVNGGTLTSGANTIPVKATQAAPQLGKSEFGMNLRANTSAAAISFPYTSADVVNSPSGTVFTGAVNTNYNTVDQFMYSSGATVASSTGPSDSQVYTASYIANVSGSQVAGTYTTTLTYICTPTY